MSRLHAREHGDEGEGPRSSAEASSLDRRADIRVAIEVSCHLGEIRQAGIELPGVTPTRVLLALVQAALATQAGLEF